MVNNDLEKLMSFWQIIEEKRLRVYNHTGVLSFTRDGEGIIQEKYYPTMEDYFKNRSEENRQTLVVDLSKKE